MRNRGGHAASANEVLRIQKRIIHQEKSSSSPIRYHILPRGQCGTCFAFFCRRGYLGPWYYEAGSSNCNNYLFIVMSQGYRPPFFRLVCLTSFWPFLFFRAFSRRHVATLANTPTIDRVWKHNQHPNVNLQRIQGLSAFSSGGHVSGAFKRV